MEANRNTKNKTHQLLRFATWESNEPAHHAWRRSVLPPTSRVPMHTERSRQRLLVQRLSVHHVRETGGCAVLVFATVGVALTHQAAKPVLVVAPACP